MPVEDGPASTTIHTLPHLSTRSRWECGPTGVHRRGWQLVARGGHDSPTRLAAPYPSRDEATAARDFALRVANSEYPIRFEGWDPWLRADGPGYVPPPAQGRHSDREDQGPTTVGPTALAVTGNPAQRLCVGHVPTVPDLPGRRCSPRLRRDAQRARR